MYLRLASNITLKLRLMKLFLSEFVLSTEFRVRHLSKSAYYTKSKPEHTLHIKKPTPPSYHLEKNPISLAESQTLSLKAWEMNSIATY